MVSYEVRILYGMSRIRTDHYFFLLIEKEVFMGLWS